MDMSSPLLYIQVDMLPYQSYNSFSGQLAGSQCVAGAHDVTQCGVS